MRLTLVVVLLLSGALVPIAALPTAAACHVEGYPRVDPVRETYTRATATGFGCTTTAIECQVTPIVEFGAPTTANGYRQGVYAYSCDLTEGSHTETSVSTSQDLGTPTCGHVPYVAVLGEQVPGTDEDYCTIQYVNHSHAQRVDTPDAVPSTGFFVVYSTDGTTGSYLVFDPVAPVAACTNPGTTLHGADAQGTQVRVIKCTT